MQAVLLDQFGVLHDGQKPYPGSVEAVKALAESGRKILIISNSSRSAPLLPLYPVHKTQYFPACSAPVYGAPVGSGGTLGKLKKMGFPEDAFYGAITSGEVCHQALQNRPNDFYRGLGKRCVHITWGARGPISLGDLDLEVPLLAACSGGLLLHPPPGGVTGIGAVCRARDRAHSSPVTRTSMHGGVVDPATECIHEPDRGMASQVVERAEEAEFMLAHGTECLGRAGDAEPREATLEEIRAVLEAGAKRGCPLLIANPDIVTVSSSGLIVMPGTFGRWYKEMGGKVSTTSLLYSSWIC